MTDAAAVRPKLSFDKANALCRNFLPIGDKIWEHMGRLQEAGYAAWQPYHRFIESFAETPEELATHRRCVCENAKERLAQPTPIRIYDEDLKHVYFSPFLQQLRAERDRVNGVPVEQLQTRYPGESAWRHHVDPCQRQLVRNEMADRKNVEARRKAMFEEQRRVIEREAERHASGVSPHHSFDEKGRYAFFTAIMQRDAAPLGFHHDKSRSRWNYPVFSKEMNADWDLCWVLEEPRPFFHSPWEGTFMPFLELRSRALRGRLNKVESGEFLQIRYLGLIPGLYSGYRQFLNLDELETLIKAHLYFYTLISPIIEDGIRRGLEAVPKAIRTSNQKT
jgi:hypothetical protein